MNREKYVYNPKKLSYEKVRVPLKHRILQCIGILSTIVISGFLFFVLADKFFPSQKEKALQREIDQMEYKYIALHDKLDVMNKVVGNIKNRDEGVYRMLFGMDPIDEAVWDGGIGGHEPYSDIMNFPKSGELLKNTESRVNKIERQLVIQSKSLEKIEKLAQNRKDMLSSIPSIKPVRVDKLHRDIKLLSGFGMRMHPIHKVQKMHKGLDFTCERGIPIQATGDGKVIRVRRDKTGYGNNVIIDHGYGYKTLYAHMSKIEIKENETVSKGQKIGEVGSTGTSTAPHCHYEVHYKNKPVNPVHFCLDGLSPREYQEMVEMASVSNQSFD